MFDQNMHLLNLMRKLLLFALFISTPLTSKSPKIITTTSFGRLLTALLAVPESQLSPKNAFWNTLPAIAKYGREIAYSCKDNFLRRVATNELLNAYQLPLDHPKRNLSSYAQEIGVLDVVNEYARPYTQRQHSPDFIHEALYLFLKAYRTAAGDFLPNSTNISSIEKILLGGNFLLQPLILATLASALIITSANNPQAINSPAVQGAAILPLLLYKLRQASPLLTLIENLSTISKLNSLLAKKSLTDAVVYSRRVPKEFHGKEYICFRSPLGMFTQQLNLLFEAPMHLTQVTTNEHPRDLLEELERTELEVIHRDATLSRLTSTPRRIENYDDVARVAIAHTESKRRSFSGHFWNITKETTKSFTYYPIRWALSWKSKRANSSLQKDRAEASFNNATEKLADLSRSPWIRTGYLDADRFLWKNHIFSALALLPLCKHCYILKTDFDALPTHIKEELGTIAARQWLSTMEQLACLLIRMTTPNAL